MRTGLGENRTRSTISRAGSETLPAGIDVKPLGSLTCPSGPVGAGGATTAVGTDVAVPLPAWFDAFTAARRVCPTSADAALYCWLVAPAMSAQLAPLASHRCHWYAYAIGAVPVQVPVEAVSVCPSWSVPLTVGGTVFAGALPIEAMAAVGSDVAALEPAAFDAVTRILNVLPTSADPVLNCPLVAPAISAQLAPLASQRCHWYA
jgi:hypothetical protein